MITGERQRIELEPTHHRHLSTDCWSGGEGPPLVLLHRDSGPTGWGELHEILGESFRVHAPTLPGFDGTSVPGWMRSVTDLAVETGHLIDLLELGPCPLVGLGFGGWVAAEIAAMSSHRASALVLQAPMGIKPPEGEILDQFLVEPERYVRMGFASEEAFEARFPGEIPAETAKAWEAAREMTVRIAWKPYMFNLSLPYLLRVVDRPTLLLGGSEDQIVPASCLEAYRTAIKGATVGQLEGAGHQIDLEQPAVLAAAITEFLVGLV